MKYLKNILPENKFNEDGNLRKIGIEIEYSGLPVEEALDIIQSLYGGQISTANTFVHRVDDTSMGDFKLELDALQLIKLGEYFNEQEPDKEKSQQNNPLDLVGNLAEQIVPWEIVTSPIPFNEIYKVATLIDSLRRAGARGTRYAWHYAFGLHLNPELPDHNAATILSYLRAYVCLYDWIKKRESVDLTRQLSPYIKHYGSSYIKKILNYEYQPDLPELISDYLDENSSRNRGLDMLPLFSWLDKERVHEKISDDRINSRPTFHFRMPNCDIDSEEWNIDLAWRSWLEVEALANNNSKLKNICFEFSKNLDRMSSALDNQWAQFLEDVVIYKNKNILIELE